MTDLEDNTSNEVGRPGAPPSVGGEGATVWKFRHAMTSPLYILHVTCYQESCCAIPRHASTGHCTNMKFGVWYKVGDYAIVLLNSVWHRSNIATIVTHNFSEPTTWSGTPRLRRQKLAVSFNLPHPRATDQLLGEPFKKSWEKGGTIHRMPLLPTNSQK